MKMKMQKSVGVSHFFSTIAIVEPAIILDEQLSTMVENAPHHQELPVFWPRLKASGLDDELSPISSQKTA
jgi:hypothetical protein